MPEVTFRVPEFRFTRVLTAIHSLEPHYSLLYNLYAEAQETIRQIQRKVFKRRSPEDYPEYEEMVNKIKVYYEKERIYVVFQVLYQVSFWPKAFDPICCIIYEYRAKEKQYYFSSDRQESPRRVKNVQELTGAALLRVKRVMKRRKLLL